MEIEVLLMAILFALFAVAGKLFFRCGINPITVFCGIWSIIMLGYGFHFYGLYYASSETLLLIFSGVLMFFVGGIVATFLRSPRSGLSTTASVDILAERPQYSLLLLLNIITFVFLLGFGITTVQMLLSGRDFYFIHKLYNQESGGTIGSSRLYQNIITWYVWPVMDASMASFAVILQCDRKDGSIGSFLSMIRDDKNQDFYKKLSMILILVNLALFTLITGKRSHLGYIVMYVIAVHFMQGRKIKLQLRTKVIIVAAFIVIVWAFDAISTSRGATSILGTLYLYLVGCVPHLSAKLESLAYRPIGLTSIYGFFQAPLIIINALINSALLTGIRMSMGTVIDITQERVLIAPGTEYNAFLTPFYYFYLDGGLWGNIILSFIFGFVAALIYINHLKKRSYKSMIIYLLVFFSLYMSMVRIQYFQMRYALSFFYVLIIFINSRKKLTFQ